MSLAVSQIERLPGVSLRVPTMTLAPGTWSEGGLLRELRQLPGASAKTASFRGRLEIPGMLSGIPDQQFKIFFDGLGASIESCPNYPWPKLSVRWQENPGTGISEVKLFELLPQGDTLDERIVGTRVAYFLVKAKKCELRVSADDLVMRFLMTTDNEQELLHYAKLVRKLKYIEKKLGIHFQVPERISPIEMGRAEIVFRGITEGEFTTRRSSVALDILPAAIDLTRPPFDGPGTWSQVIESSGELLGQQIPTGPIRVTLKQAELADPQVLRHIKAGRQEAISVRFALLDHQVTCRFEDYARLPKNDLQKQIKQFKKELLLEEPVELASLIDEPITLDVSAEEASLIAMGWTQYNHLPDRYCPQEPSLTADVTSWRVPIHLVYTSGQGGLVGELLIDRKTGRVTSHTPIEELRNKGRAIAATLSSHAS